MSVLKEFYKLDFHNRIYILLLSCFWLLGYFTAFWRRVGIAEQGITVANLLLLLVLAFLCTRIWKNRIHFSDVALYMFLLFTYFINPIIYPLTAKLTSFYAVDVALGAMPFLFMGLIFNYKGYEKWISILSRVTIAINIFYTYLVSSSDENGEELMVRAYILLPSVLYLFWMYFEKHKYNDLIFFLLGFFIECSMGTRGPFVCILFFAAVYLFFFKKYKHAILIRLVIVVGTLFLYLFSTNIAYVMVGLLSLFGKSTRIFDLMLDDALVNYEDSNGRDMIQGFLLQRLDINNGVGYGLFADRLHGAYAHNIFVEMWYDFGYIYGSIIISVYLLLVALLLIKTNSANTKVFVLLFFCASFVKLQFSGSFIVDRYLFFLLGFCINGLREVNPSKVTQKYKLYN